MKFPFWSRKRRDAELEEEIRSHLVMAEEELKQQGAPAVMAASAARRELGNIGLIKEATRAVWTGASFDPLLHDVRYAVRQLIRNPAFAIVVVVTLALGVGANTAVFSLVNHILLRPLPGADDDGSLVSVWFPNDGKPSFVSYPDYRSFADAATAFNGLGTEIRGPVARLRSKGITPRMLPIDIVTDNYFSVLGVPMLLGRPFVSADLEEGSPPVAVLSYRLWSGVFRGDSTVVGRTIQLEDADVMVIGVANQRFTGTDRIVATDAWLPFSALATVLHAFGPSASIADYLEHRRTAIGVPELFGRLAPGATVARAQAQLREVQTRLVANAPAEAVSGKPTGRAGGFPGAQVTVGRGVGLFMAVRERVGETLRLLWWIAGAFILVAVANVTNMLLFRGVRRREEVAIRRAIGASAGRLLQQNIIETILLAALSGVVAGGLAYWLAATFRGLRLGGLSPMEEVAPDWRVYAFGMGFSVLAGLTLGMVPTFLSRDSRLAVSLKESVARSTARRTVLRGALTVLQLAVSVALLVGALLLSQTVRGLRSVDLGFDPTDLGVFSLDFETHGESKAQAGVAVQALREQIAALPGVTGVTTLQESPFDGRIANVMTLGQFVARDKAPAAPGEGFMTMAAWVAPDYFTVARTPVLKGRTFTVEADSSPSRPHDAVLTASLARQLFGDDDPLDRTFFVAGATSGARYRVNGVVADTRWRSINGPAPGPVLFRSLNDPNAPSSPSAALLVRSVGSFSRLRAAVEPLIRARVPEVPLTVRTMDDLIDATISEQKLFARISLSLTLLALALSTVGVYSLLSFAVAERTREIGIRRALGARAWEIARLVGQQGFVLASLAVVVGLTSAAVLSKLITARLFGVRPLEPAVYVAAAVILVALALVASLVPVKAAVGVDPIVALKSE